MYVCMYVYIYIYMCACVFAHLAIRLAVHRHKSSRQPPTPGALSGLSGSVWFGCGSDSGADPSAPGMEQLRLGLFGGRI